MKQSNVAGNVLSKVLQGYRGLTIMSDYDGPIPDDEVAVDTTSDDRQVWHRHKGKWQDISKMVDSVTPGDGQFEVTGHKIKYGYPQTGVFPQNLWKARVEEDGESSEGMRKGRVIE